MHYPGVQMETSEKTPRMNNPCDGLGLQNPAACDTLLVCVFAVTFKNALIIHKENTKKLMFNECLYI